MTTDERRRVARPDDTRQTGSGRDADQVTELPKPTQDQEDYLCEIRRTSTRYDPKVLVGGPRRA